ncbi:MAG TPA: MOSC and FAD-binding oxidoreductase domain-containing protein [Dyella sp.]|uniref:MOSC and FAD-binding oxidoreductase domain-containing protein n=1 Tax=Dyella sp. TaxID=1869338 RepID=UPI002BB0B30A|nr:MOSC and FAD-binding oxidoreductase domain-containing protein [Dyella sp.]HUB91228.1 MOSC and FAD-binding oxidoreductase domain-containing protein [Dyella sp.]
MATLVSINVGLPKDIPWQGRVVHTAVWKTPVKGRVMVRRLNIEGDGQGDLGGHGGEHRAVMVYQLHSYRYWQDFLQRPALEFGSFGENFTVDELADDEVCIGDRYRIGDALFEVTQPRVTCYRVGIRMNHPQMASLLVSHRRPGFYFRVIEEGVVGAGDAIVKEHSADGLAVSVVDGLLYLPGHSREQLERAVHMPALSEGWRQAFAAMLEAGPQQQGNVGLTGPAAVPPAWTGFRNVRVSATHDESASVRSFTVEAVDGEALPSPRGGQFVVVRMTPPLPRRPILRSYSISDGSTPGRYRFSVKRGMGEGSQYLHDEIQDGDVLAISAPRGTFCLGDGCRPLVFWSAGIGITPVLAMLHELAARSDTNSRAIYWIYGARSGEESVFAGEVDELLGRLRQARRLVGFSRPDPADRLGAQFDVEGRIDAAMVAALSIPSDALFYLCGPAPFMTAAREGLSAAGYAKANILTELFGAQDALRPGIAAAANAIPHPPEGETADGPVVTFVRSGLAVHWGGRYGSLLELAEACDIPVRWSCRTGVCHNCETAVIGGAVDYSTAPIDPPADGQVLICCSVPREDLQLDL